MPQAAEPTTLGSRDGAPSCKSGDSRPVLSSYAELTLAHRARHARNRMTELWHLGGTLTNVRRAYALVDQVTVAERTTRIEVRRKDGRVLGHADVPSAWVKDDPVFPELEHEAAAR